MSMSGLSVDLIWDGDTGIQERGGRFTGVARSTVNFSRSKSLKEMRIIT